MTRATPPCCRLIPELGSCFYADPLRVSNPTARMGLEIMRAISDARSNIERVTMPTLVVHGGDDRLVPTEASEIFETLPNVKRIVYPELRHEVFNEPSGPEIIDEVIAWINIRTSRSALLLRSGGLSACIMQA